MYYDLWFLISLKEDRNGFDWANVIANNHAKPATTIHFLEMELVDFKFERLFLK